MQMGTSGDILVFMDRDDLNSLYGIRSHPYFIYTPRWVDSSAGIKALHYLCHAINMAGSQAYLVLTEASHQGLPRINPDLHTPILTQEVSDAYFRNETNPIVIYSETIPGNPLNANCIVRFLMNYCGSLGGPTYFEDGEHIVAFSKNIAFDYSSKNNTDEPPVLFIPPIDPREFTKNEEKDDFQVSYAGKYRSFVGKPPKVGFQNNFEIFRDGPKMQNRKQVIEILSKTSVLYSFENSSIVTEAILSGTPVKFVENQFLGEIIAEHELGTGGLVLGSTQEDIEKARGTIDEGISKYYEKTSDFLRDLNGFIAVTQEQAKYLGFKDPINVPVHANLFSEHRLGLARQIILHQGLKTLTRVVFRFMLRRLSWRFWIGKEKNGVVK